MNEPTPEEQGRAGDTEIKNYEGIFNAVKAGALRGVVISIWHKGTDINIDGDKGFVDYFEDWYNESWGRGVFHPYTNRICIELSTEGEELFFDISEIWDRRADGSAEDKDKDEDEDENEADEEKLKSYMWLVTPSV